MPKLRWEEVDHPVVMAGVLGPQPRGPMGWLPAGIPAGFGEHVVNMWEKATKIDDNWG